VEYSAPSQSNPGLILLIVDVSYSMSGSKVLEHIRSAIKELRALGRKKPRSVKFHCLVFSQLTREENSWLEEAKLTGYKNLGVKGITSVTNLKAACKDGRRIYLEHVKDCTTNNPLTNILFFTDGGHTGSLDVERNSSGQYYNEWHTKKPNKWLNLVTLPNVLIGVIDYGDHPLPQLPEPSVHIPGTKYTDASILQEGLISNAYLREKENPPPQGHSLLNIFGPQENLIGNKFIISHSIINASPRVTSAFIKLGTFGFRNDFGEDKPGFDGGSGLDDDWL
jgi:hypothetical protein